MYDIVIIVDCVYEERARERVVTHKKEGGQGSCSPAAILISDVKDQRVWHVPLQLMRLLNVMHFC